MDIVTLTGSCSEHVLILRASFQNSGQNVACTQVLTKHVVPDNAAPVIFLLLLPSTSGEIRYLTPQHEPRLQALF